MRTRWTESGSGRERASEGETVGLLASAEPDFRLGQLITRVPSGAKTLC